MSLSSPDSAYVAGTTFSCALIEDDGELHLVPGLQLQAVLHLFYMEEQLFAIAHFVGYEAKLESDRTMGFRTENSAQLKQLYYFSEQSDSLPGL